MRRLSNLVRFPRAVLQSADLEVLYLLKHPSGLVPRVQGFSSCPTVLGCSRMKPRIWSRKAIYSRCISILDISGRYKISAVIFRGRRQAARRIDGQIAALRTTFVAAPKAERGGPKPRYGRPVETQKRLGRQLPNEMDWAAN